MSLCLKDLVECAHKQSEMGDTEKTAWSFCRIEHNRWMENNLEEITSNHGKPDHQAEKQHASGLLHPTSAYNEWDVGGVLYL